MMSRISGLLRSSVAFLVASLVMVWGGVRGTELEPGVRVVSSRASRLVVGGASPTDSVIVGFHDSVSDRVAEQCVREAGAGGALRSAFSKRFLAMPDDGLDTKHLLSRLRAMPEVAYAEEDGVVRAHFVPNDSLYRLQWHWRALGMERTWDIQRGDASVAVAVLDTGVAYEDFGKFRRAPDWGGVTFLTGYNVFTKDTHANDDNFHGTHVASVIGEGADNALGGSGMIHRVAIMPVKVLDEDGFGTNSGIAEGIDAVVRFRLSGVNPVKVINLSLGGSVRSTAVQNAVNAAIAAGITVVASAGNDNVSTIDFPAALDNVIAVGATDGLKSKAPYSSFGAALDLMAPGGDLGQDADRDGRPDGILQQTFDPDTAFFSGRYDDFAYFFVSGTSQAAPQVSALAALIARQGVTSPAAIKALMEKTAEDLGVPGFDERFGHGLIRPAEALKGLGLNR